MKLGEKWTIYWSNYMTDAYIYGSEVVFLEKDHILFKNKMMPPGATVKRWYSKTTYQSNRIEPTLPIIDGEGEYRISINMELPFDEAIMVRIVFLDRYDSEVGHIIVREKEYDFRCPMATYSYRIELINAGAEEFVFHSFSIQELVHEQEDNTKTTE